MTAPPPAGRAAPAGDVGTSGLPDLPRLDASPHHGGVCRRPTQPCHGHSSALAVAYFDRIRVPRFHGNPFLELRRVLWMGQLSRSRSTQQRRCQASPVRQLSSAEAQARITRAATRRHAHVTPQAFAATGWRRGFGQVDRQRRSHMAFTPPDGSTDHTKLCALRSDESPDLAVHQASRPSALRGASGARHQLELMTSWDHLPPTSPAVGR